MVGYLLVVLSVLVVIGFLKFIILRKEKVLRVLVQLGQEMVPLKRGISMVSLPR